MGLKCNPDFIMTLDGDEVIMPNMKQILKEDLTILNPQADVYNIKFLEVREKPNQIRINDLTATDKDNAVFIGNDSSHIENDFNADAVW